MYLTFDEREEFVDRRGVEATFRVRVWQAKDRTPIVLISQERQGDGFGPTPRILAAKVSNWVRESVLHHNRLGAIFFVSEWAALPGMRGRTEMVCFDFFGHWQRCRLIKPIFVAKEWEDIEAAVGYRVEP